MFWDAFKTLYKLYIASLKGKRNYKNRAKKYSAKKGYKLQNTDT